MLSCATARVWTWRSCIWNSMWRWATFVGSQNCYGPSMTAPGWQSSKLKWAAQRSVKRNFVGANSGGVAQRLEQRLHKTKKTYQPLEFQGFFVFRAVQMPPEIP